MTFIRERGIQFARPFYVDPGSTRVTKAPTDARTEQFRAHALPQNHSSRDRGNQLKVNPIARSRRGNKW